MNPPHSKMTAKYVGPVNRNGKDDKKGWAKVIWSDGDEKTHAHLIDKTRLKSDKIPDLKPGQWTILDSAHEEKVCANALLATDDYLMYKCFTMDHHSKKLSIFNHFSSKYIIFFQNCTFQI